MRSYEFIVKYISLKKLLSLHQKEMVRINVRKDNIVKYSYDGNKSLGQSILFSENIHILLEVESEILTFVQDTNPVNFMDDSLINNGSRASPCKKFLLFTYFCKVGVTVTEQNNFDFCSKQDVIKSFGDTKIPLVLKSDTASQFILMIG